jgi:hypothetical protein
LLAPHLSYLAPLEPLLARPELKALAHITGGGLTDNLPRVLPAGLAAEIRFGSWEIPHPFRALQDGGDVELEEMFRVFNMGIGMVAIVAATDLPAISKSFAAAGQRAIPIGRVVEGDGVIYDLGSTEPEGEGDWAARSPTPTSRPPARRRRSRSCSRAGGRISSPSMPPSNAASWRRGSRSWSPTSRTRPA